jgi:hypothetical protein
MKRFDLCQVRKRVRFAADLFRLAYWVTMLVSLFNNYPELRRLRAA